MPRPVSPPEEASSSEEEEPGPELSTDMRRLLSHNRRMVEQMRLYGQVHML